MKRAALAFVAMVFAAGSAHAQASQGLTWKGRSNASGGVVDYGYQLTPEDPGFDFEMAESESLQIRCDGFDGRLTIAFAANVHPDDERKHNVIFEMGYDRFERSGPLDEGGLFPGAPIATMEKGDPVIAALVRSRSIRVHVGTLRVEPLLDLPLTDAHDLFREHLRACLAR